jgi:glycosyltransferase involved in cell wall biosynthesis
VLVCTSNRPDSLLRAVRSLLTTRDADFELIVIDQSNGLESQRALSDAIADPRLRYVRVQPQGKGAALNEGLRQARAEIVVCTDDDCEVPSGWISAMATTLVEQPTAAVAFCNIVAPPCDWTAGYIPTYERRENRLLRSLIDTCTGHGMGAGMALRRDVVQEWGGFDEQVGPGARFPSGDDWDIAHRALLKGWHVYETVDLRVLHHGFRTLEQGRGHMHRDWFGIGAVCAKPIRAGHSSGVLLALWVFAAYALWPPLHDVLRLRRPTGRSQIAGFIEGFVKGILTPVDRRTLLFHSRRS